MPSTSPGAEPVRFTSDGLRRGFWAGQPLAPGVFMFALVYGALANEKALSLWQSMLTSLLVYSGTAQLAALQGWGTAAPNVVALLTPLVATVLVMNARYVLYGASIQPWLKHATRTQAWGSLFFMGDGNWALSVREYDKGYRDVAFVLGSGLSTFAPWVAGTAIGYLLARSMADPAAFGLDFMLVGFATAIGISLWKGRSSLWPAAAAAAAAWLCHRFVPGAWYIVAAGVAGGLVGAWRHGR